MSSIWKCWRGACLIVLCVMLYCGTPVRADADAAYRLAAGDSITVTVVNHPTFGGTVSVMGDGTVMLPVVGQCKVAGQTLAEVVTFLRQAYTRRLNNPEVYVTLTSMQVAVTNVYVLGAVKTPGMFPLKAKMGVLELILAADGLAQDPADCQGTLLRKATQERVPIALKELMSGQPVANLALADGDILSIEAHLRLPVYVYGNAVKTPGAYPLKGTMGVFEMVLAADGLTRDLAECQAALIRKGTKERVPIVLAEIMSGQPAANVALGDGDTLIIDARPSIPVFVSGEVEVAGVIEVPQGATITQALARARGIRGESREKQLVLTRGKDVITIGLSTLYQPGTTMDLPLQTGDVIRVESALITVSIAGEVTNANNYTVKPDLNLAELLALAGGTTQFARLNALTITHNDGRQKLIDLGATPPEKIGDFQTGDRIYVPSNLVGVTVAGGVKTTGPLRLPAHINISEVITLAGGATETAALSAVRVIHPNGDIQTVDATRVADKNGDLVLVEGDRIVVPNTTTQIAVVGNVRTPGYVPIDEKNPFTVSQAIIRAGGLEEKSATSRITLTRKVNGVQTRKTIDFDKTLRAKKAADDVLLQPGDVVMVPKSNMTLTDLLGAYSLISVLFL